MFQETQRPQVIEILSISPWSSNLSRTQTSQGPLQATLKFLHIYKYFILKEVKVEKENFLWGIGISVTISASISASLGLYPLCCVWHLFSPPQSSCWAPMCWFFLFLRILPWRSWMTKVGDQPFLLPRGTSDSCCWVKYHSLYVWPSQPFKVGSHWHSRNFSWVVGNGLNCPLLLCDLLGSFLVSCETSLWTKGQERPKKEADHSSLAGGRFKKQGNLHRGLSWVAAR